MVGLWTQTGCPPWGPSRAPVHRQHPELTAPALSGTLTLTCPTSPGGVCAPVEASVHLPAASAEQQCTRQHHEGTPDKERHHHHQEQIVVQDRVGLCLRGQQVRGQGQWA